MRLASVSVRDTCAGGRGGWPGAPEVIASVANVWIVLKNQFEIQRICVCFVSAEDNELSRTFGAGKGELFMRL